MLGLGASEVQFANRHTIHSCMDYRVSNVHIYEDAQLKS